MKILLMCGAGASSGFMAQAMRKAAKEQGLDDIDVIARSEAEMTNNLKGTDIIMFGPHLAYKKDALAKDLEQYNIPFAFIDKDAYGAIDGAATLKQAMDVLKGAKPQEVEKEPVKEVEKKEVKADKNVENQKGFMPASPTSSSRAQKPGRSVFWSWRRPALTMVRFSPVRGMTSATVPTAARSPQYSSISSGGHPSSAAQSLKATPAPHRPLKGLWSSARRGSTMATACGRLSWGRWWSVMMRSMPRLAAKAASSTAEIPLSTVTMRRHPLS